MTAAQLTGGGLGAVLAGVLVQVLNRYTSVTIDLAGATAIVTAMIAGVGLLAHGIDVYGLKGVVGRIWRGRATPTQ